MAAAPKRERTREPDFAKELKRPAPAAQRIPSLSAMAAKKAMTRRAQREDSTAR